MKSPQRRHSEKGVFQIHSSVSGLNFSNNISVTQVRLNMRETERDTTFEIYQTPPPPWYYQIISPPIFLPFVSP